MNISEIMTRDVRTCRLDDSLETPARIMWETDCGCVPVIDPEGRVTGVITDRDICMAAYTQGKPLCAINVASTAVRDLIAAREDKTIESVEALMRKHRVRRVPIVDAMGRLVGIVSLNDLARRSHLGGNRTDGLSAANVIDTLAAICEPNERGRSEQTRERVAH